MQGDIFPSTYKLVEAFCIFWPGKLSGRGSGAMGPNAVSPMASSEERDRLGRKGRAVSMPAYRIFSHFAAYAIAAAATCKVFFTGDGRVPEGQWDTPALAEGSSCGCSSAAEGKRRGSRGREHQGHFLGVHALV